MNDPVAPIPPFPNDEYDNPEYHPHLASHYVFQTSAGRAVENFMDWSHFPFVHPGLLAPADAVLVPPVEVTETEYGLAYTYPTIEPASPTSGPSETVMYEYYYYLPFTIHIRIVAAEGVSYCSYISSPTSKTTTDGYTMFVRNYALDRPDSDFDYFANRVTEQDRRIIESQRPEQIPLDLREELHIKIPDAADGRLPPGARSDQGSQRLRRYMSKSPPANLSAQASAPAPFCHSARPALTSGRPRGTVPRHGKHTERRWES